MSRVISSAFGILLGVGLACFVSVGSGSPTHALDASSLVINTVQLGDAQSANNEIIEVSNNSLDTVEVTNWCLYYASATSITNGTKLACFTTPTSLDHLYLDGHTSIVLVSKQFLVVQPALMFDYSFSATLSGAAGHVRLIDADGNIVDKVAWGSAAVSPEAVAASAPLVGMALSRVLAADVYTDTDNNAADFSMVALPLTIPAQQLYMLEDVCGNIDGMQLFVPDDLIVDNAGQCTIPVVDLCSNILGVQVSVPSGYELRADGLCWQTIEQLVISEILPNPTGADTGGEFIELYNPLDHEVSLANYVVKVGQSLETSFKFTHGETVPAAGYLVMKNSDYSFSLLNSTDLVALMTADGQLIDQILPYDNPDDGLAWVMIHGTWQYTNHPTPGGSNLLSLDSVDSDMASAGVALAPCAATQYRNPATGRCKLLAGQSSTLVPCKDNQYRSEETGRCRTIAAVTGPAPCPAGQERNADTGRCRKAVASSPPKVSYAVLGASTSGNQNYLLCAVLGLGALGLGYAIWEWHTEISKVFQKARSFIRLSK